jgi:hypothetical protein
MIVVAYWLRRNTIPKSPAFDLGKWAVPLLALSLIWEVYLIFDFTLPSIFHKAAEVFVGAQIVAALWYFLALRGRLRRGEAGQALSKGKLAGAHVMAATAGTAPAGPAAPEPEAGE